MSVRFSPSQIFKSKGKKKAKAELHAAVIDGISVMVDTDESAQKLGDIIAKLREIETGRDVLEVLEQTKTPLMMESMGNTIGYFSSPNLKIALNYEIPVEKLCSTLVHESHHLMQYLAGGNVADRYALNVKSQIMVDRAKEADAQTWAMRACHEWRMKGDDKPFLEFKKRYPEIANAFDNALKENGGVMNNAVLTATFKSWYDQVSIRTIYENSYMLHPARCDLGKNSLELRETRRADGFYYVSDNLHTVTPQEIINMTAKTYFTETPDILEDARFLSVLPFAKDSLMYVMARTGRNDATCAALPETDTSRLWGDTYLVQSACEDMAEVFRGSVRQVAMEANVPYKDLKHAVTGGNAAKNDFVAQYGMNMTIAKYFGRLALLHAEEKKVKAFRKTLKEEKKIGRTAEMTPERAAKCADARLALMETDALLLGMSFIQDYGASKPTLVTMFLASDFLTDDMRQKLNAGKPMPLVMKTPNTADMERLAMVQNIMKTRLKQVALLREEQKEKRSFDTVKAYMTDPKNVGRADFAQNVNKRVMAAVLNYSAEKKAAFINRLMADETIAADKKAVVVLAALLPEQQKKAAVLKTVLSGKAMQY